MTRPRPRIPQRDDNPPWLLQCRVMGPNGHWWPATVEVRETDGDVSIEVPTDAGTTSYVLRFGDWSLAAHFFNIAGTQAMYHKPGVLRDR